MTRWAGEEKKGGVELLLNIRACATQEKEKEREGRERGEKRGPSPLPPFGTSLVRVDERASKKKKEKKGERKGKEKGKGGKEKLAAQFFSAQNPIYYVIWDGNNIERCERIFFL